MAYYRHETTEKTYNRFTEKQDDVLDATIELATHLAYERDGLFKIAGVGVFEGTYRFKKTTFTINPSGFTVSADARMVWDSKGNPVENGYKPAPPTSSKPAKPKETPKKVPSKDYVVKSGDTLSAIAKRLCKNVSDWKKIEEANRSMLVARDKRN